MSAELVSSHSRRRRIGSVPYLNAVPLTRGIEDETVFLPPNALRGALERGDLDVALLSVTETLFDRRYRIVDGIGVCSRGAVESVFLVHSVPLEEIVEVHCDPASLTSVNLLRVLLGWRGVQPRWRVLEDYESAGGLENVLLIGNPAIRFRRRYPRRRIWDLGAAWDDAVGLPFVYAVWAVRREVSDVGLIERLRVAYERGLREREEIICSYSEFDVGFRRRYLMERIRYFLGADEKRGLARFVGELRRFEDLTVFEPEFVEGV